MSVEILPFIVGTSFLFELIDSAAGMGFGTALAPLLFLLAYKPLQVVPVLLISETATGFISGIFHHEFSNVRFERNFPPRGATGAVLLVACFGSMGALFSILLVYMAIETPEFAIKTYVSGLVLMMGIIGLLRLSSRRERWYRPRLLAGFAALAGFNKGIGVVVSGR